MKRIHSITVLGFSLFAFASAMATDGYVTGQVNMRAGPDASYPSVVVLGTGTEVSIQGCVDGWSWCDVITGGNRGWVAGSYLQENYQGQRVLVPAYGVQIGIPIVSFVFGTYWDDNYRNRPWYGQREHWSQVRPNYRPVAARGDDRHGASNEAHANERGARANDAGPSRTAYAPAMNEPRSATAQAAKPAHHVATSPIVAAQHHAATAQHRAVPAGRSVAQARVAAPHAAPSHAAPAARAARPASPEKSAPREEKGDDKGQH